MIFLNASENSYVSQTHSSKNSVITFETRSLHSFLYIKLVLSWSFAYSVTPSPLEINKPFQISWLYDDGDSPDNMFAILVEGAGGYTQWLGYYNSTIGNITAKGPPSTGFAATSLASNVF